MRNNIEFNAHAPHVVFLDATGNVAFDMRENNYHLGCTVIEVFENFYIAAAYVQALQGKVPTLNCAWLVWHENKIEVNGQMKMQSREELKLPAGLTTDEMKQAFTTVLNAKYPPGSWRLQYWLGFIKEDNTDSIGNALPKDVWLSSNATRDEIGRALTVNSFNLAVAVAMRQGKTVVYDSGTKQATIQRADGFVFFVEHS
jgi:hypothetical protein